MERIDALTMNSIGFAIQCNFPRFCGMERAKEAAEQFRVMKEELLAYRAAMPLEKAQALKDAEEQGLLVKLPCKVGDTVYALFCNEVIEKQIGRFIINVYTNPALWVELDCKFLTSVTERWDIGVGTKFYLTRDKAEAALREANRKG